MKKTVYVFGNEYLKGDDGAKEITRSVKKKDIHFKWCTSPDDLLDAKGGIVILDVVRNIKKVCVIHDLKKLKTRKLLSLHDYDLGFFLTLMQKLGKINKVTIIGLPKKGSKEKLKNEVIKELDNLL